MENCFPFDCRACGHLWDQPFDLPMEMQKMARAVNRVVCPKCGATGKQLTVNFTRPRVAHADERHQP